MKLTLMVMLTMLLSISCTKRDSISDFEPAMPANS